MFVTKEYNRDKALAYAKRWALDRNPLFFSFNGIGGDCTNFVSQCIFAGGCVMNYTPTYGWYYISSSDRTPSWSGVQFFYDFMVNNKEQGPFATEVTADRIERGDIIQLGNEEGLFYHSLIV
ncbi:MAG: amidase domain-containing protein, partial [Clostridia bacterium]|nr:amidase domain-containing protein [Clostridia bacterium]